MNKKLPAFICLMLLFAVSNSFGQRVSLFSQVGFSDAGYNQWYETNADITVGLIIPVSPTLAIVPFGTFGGNAKYFYYDVKENEVDAEAYEFGGMLRYTALRTQKFEIYLQGAASSLTVSYSGAASQNPSIPAEAKQTSFVGGVGVGFVYKLTNAIQINLLEVDMSYVNLEMIDRWLHKDYKAGLIIQFQRGK